MSLQPYLEKAVDAEVAYSRAFAIEQAKRPLPELRKEGLAIEPAKVIELIRTLKGTLVSFQTSYAISTAFFKKGARLRCVAIDETQDGIVYELDGNLITAFFSEIESLEIGDLLRLDFVPDDRTLRCLELGIQFLKEKQALIQFEDSLKNEAVPVNPIPHSALNESQQKALGAILSKNPVVTIQGPPGTGKTHTLACAIEALVNSGLRVLVCAPSNAAVDNIANKIVSLNLELVRVGNGEKVHDSVKPYFLDVLAESKNYGSSISHMQQQLKKVEQVANRHIRNYTQEAAAEKKTARKEMRELQRAIRNEGQAVEQLILSKSKIVAGTPVGIFNTLSKNDYFDVVLVDEAGQCLSPLIWLIAVFGKRLVLCGDPQQLPPTILAPEAKKTGLGISLLEASYISHPPILLTHQYRMAEPISTLISNNFYGGNLVNCALQKSGELCFIDTAGFDALEEENEISGSFANPIEVKIVEALISEKDLKPEDTVLMTPYNGQISLLEKQFKGWHVSTIDAIQGQEKRNVIISMVRSNEAGDIGFLSDYRRMNVAISRAQLNCYLIGDSATLANDSFYNGLLQQIEDKGNYRSAWEFSLI